jgi:hypothetical protein
MLTGTRKMKRIMIAATVAVLVGCQAPMVTWDKPGVTQQEFNMDSAQCDNQAFSLVGAPMIQRNLVNQSCMRAKGYLKVDD